MNAIDRYERENFWPEGYYARNYKMCTTLGCKPMNFFDPESIMMYGPFLQGTNITVIRSKVFCNGKPCELGQRRQLSFLDIKDISTAYECGKLSGFILNIDIVIILFLETEMKI